MKNVVIIGAAGVVGTELCKEATKRLNEDDTLMLVDPQFDIIKTQLDINKAEPNIIILNDNYEHCRDFIFNGPTTPTHVIDTACQMSAIETHFNHYLGDIRRVNDYANQQKHFPGMRVSVVTHHANMHSNDETSNERIQQETLLHRSKAWFKDACNILQQKNAIQVINAPFILSSNSPVSNFGPSAILQRIISAISGNRNNIHIFAYEYESGFDWCTREYLANNVFEHANILSKASKYIGRQGWISMEMFIRQVLAILEYDFEFYLLSDQVDEILTADSLIVQNQLGDELRSVIKETINGYDDNPE